MPSWRSSILGTLALLLTIAPLSGAQTAPLLETTTTLRIAPLTDPLPAGGSFAAVPGQVEHSFLCAVPTTRPTTIHLEVVEAPEWAVASLSPSQISMPVGSVCVSGGSVTMVSDFALMLGANPGAPAFTPGVVRIAAFAEPNGLYQGSGGQADVPVQASPGVRSSGQPVQKTSAPSGEAQNDVPGPGIAIALIAIGAVAVLLAARRRRQAR